VRRDVIGGTTGALALIGLGVVGQSACFSNRLHDPSLECGGGDCSCVAGRANCNGDWSDGCEVDILSGDAHCGGCGWFCDHGTCNEGVCVCDAPAVFADCDGDRANGCEQYLQGEDAENCGACGNRCADDEFCQDGVCTAYCLNSELCGTECVDLSQDPQHCGDCNVQCSADQQCFEGLCVPCDEVCWLCLDDDLGSAVPTHLTGFPSTNGLLSSCLEVPLPGSVYRFLPPVTGRYSVTTFGSAADTSLSIFEEGEPPCSQLACHNDALGTGAATVFDAEAGAAILIQVATKNATPAFHRLHITETTDGVCILGWLGWNFPSAATGDFLNAVDALQPSCAPAGGLEEAALLIAPEAGYYLIDTAGSDADTVLFVLDDSCSGTELGCDDDTGGDDAQLTLELFAGQAVVVVVEQRADGPPGGYQLSVEGPL